MRNELSGVLNWALRGCLEWQRSGLQIPKTVMAFTEDYRAETDLVGLWLDECCVIAPGAVISIADAYSSFQTYCKDAGHQHPPTKMWLSRALTQRGFKDAPGTAVRKRVGFQLRIDAEDSRAALFDDEEDYDVL